MVSKQNMRLLHLDAVQERLEQHSEAYKKYVERVAQSLTQQCAESLAVLPVPQAGRRGGAGGAGD